MPYHAGNKIPVGANWTAQATFRWPYSKKPGAVKLDVFVNGTDVVVQFLEADDGGWADDVTQEILLRQGFQSVPVETPFVAWRFKVWSQTLLATTGTVDMRAMA